MVHRVTEMFHRLCRANVTGVDISAAAHTHTYTHTESICRIWPSVTRRHLRSVRLSAAAAMTSLTYVVLLANWSSTVFTNHPLLQMWPQQFAILRFTTA